MTLRNPVYKQNNFLVNVKMKIFNTGVTLTATLSSLKQWLQLRFDFNSTVVRLSFDCRLTPIRLQFDQLRPLNVTTYLFRAAAVRPK